MIQVSDDASTWRTIYSGNGKVGIQDLTGLSGLGRYIRVYGVQRATPYGYSLYEFEVYGSRNLSIGSAATASSVENASYAAGNAVDGNNATRWSSTFGDPQWIEVDLGKICAIGAVRLNWEAAYAAAFQLQISEDGTNWRTIYSGAGNQGIQDLLGLSAFGRYVRVYGTQRATPYGYSLFEFEIYGGANLALAQPATASSVESPSYAAGNAVDGNNTSRWSSAFSDPQWLQVDLGATQAVGAVRLSWEAAYASAFQIQVSDDASTWRAIYSGSGNVGLQELVGLAGLGRYVRVYGTQRATPYGYSLYEFEVYGAAGKPSSASPAVFAASSFWYQPIPANAPLNTNSANYVSEFLRQKSAYYGTVNINGVNDPPNATYSSPVYGDPNAPAVTVTQWDCQNKGYLDAGLKQQWSAVPMPSYAEPSDGTDQEMTVYSGNRLFEFWQARIVNGAWQGCWGGGIDNVSSNPGIWPYPYGATATGLPFIGGQITAEELQSGHVNHVMGIALVDLENWNIFSWPANRSDGYNPNNASNRIPEGLRFRLDPTINVDALTNLHPVAKIIAKAAQTYGFVVWDKAGAISLRAQNSKSYIKLGQPNPYTSLLAGTPDYQILNNFPWDRLQFLPMDYGKP